MTRSQEFSTGLSPPGGIVAWLEAPSWRLTILLLLPLPANCAPVRLHRCIRSDTGSGGSRCAFAAVSWPITRFGGSPRRCIVVLVVTTHASRAHARLLSDIRATGKPVPVVGEGSFVYGAHRARFLVALPCLNLYKWE